MEDQAQPPQKLPYHVLAHRMKKAEALADELHLQLAESRGIVHSQGKELERLWRENRTLRAKKRVASAR